MFSFLVAHAAIGAVKALPKVLERINAGLDVVIAQQQGVRRVVVNINIGVSAMELDELRSDPKFRRAIERGDLMRRAGEKVVAV